MIRFHRRFYALVFEAATLGFVMLVGTDELPASAMPAILGLTRGLSAVGQDRWDDRSIRPRFRSTNLGPSYRVNSSR